jgi:hypothetical protein
MLIVTHDMIPMLTFRGIQMIVYVIEDLIMDLIPLLVVYHKIRVDELELLDEDI